MKKVSVAELLSGRGNLEYRSKNGKTTLM